MGHGEHDSAHEGADGSAVTPGVPDRIVRYRGPDGEYRGEVDELVVTGAAVHVEQMDPGCWWIGISRDDGTRWSGFFLADHSGQMTLVEQDDEIDWDQDTVRDEHR